MNSIIYSPNMLQLYKNSAVNPGFKGNSMQEYNEYLNKINTCINNDTIPKKGIFPPVKAEKIFKDNDAIVFQVIPSKKDEYAKELSVGYINANTKQIASMIKHFENKTALLDYITSIDEESLKKLIESFKDDTE